MSIPPAIPLDDQIIPATSADRETLGLLPDGRIVFAEENSREERGVSRQKPPPTEPQFLPIDKDDERLKDYPKLNYKYPALLTKWLALWCVLVFCILAALIILPILESNNPRILHIRQDRPYGKYAYQYIPGIVGTITIIWFRAIQQSFNRIRPYVTMANPPNTGNIASSADQAYLTQHLDMTYSAIPDIHTWRHAIRHRHWLTVFVNIIGNYGGIFVVPFKFTFLRVQQDPSGDGWDLRVSGTSAVILGAIYTVYLVLGISLPLYFRKKQTGLRWDPSSLASQIGLLHQTNMRKALEGTEFLTIQELQALVQTWPSRFGNLKLGYWERRDRPNDRPVYGIHFVSGNTSTPINTRTVQLGAYELCPYGIDVVPEAVLVGSAPSRTTPRWRRDENLARRNLAFHRYFISNIFLSDFYITLMILVSLGLAITMTCFLASGSLSNPFPVFDHPDKPASTTSQVFSLLSAFSSRSFVHRLVYNSLPVLYFALVGMPIIQSDTWHRVHWPIHAMDKPLPAPENLLVNYTSPLLPEILFRAWAAGHYRIFLGSVLNIVATINPLVAGGIFLVDETSSTVETVWPNTGYIYAMLWWNCAALLFCRPDMTYCAGRGLATILDVASYCYDSPLIEDEAFRYDEPSDRMEHADARVLVAKDMYQYGYYVGGSGRRRLGFSVARRHAVARDGAEVEPVDRVKLRYRFLRFQSWFFRRPTVGDDPGEAAADEKGAGLHGLSGARDASYLAQQPGFYGGQREENGEEL